MIKFVWIMGNIGVGKSTLVKNLKPIFPKKWKFWNIDDVRFAKNQEKSKLVEDEIRADFIKEMDQIKPFAVLESVGTYGRIALDNFKPEEVLIIKLEASTEVLMSRLSIRLKDPSLVVPFPGIEQSEPAYQRSIVNFESIMNRVSPHEVIDTSLKNEKQVLEEVLDILKNKKILK